jgi:hypothetical protein
MTLTNIYSRYLQGGTKGFTVKEGRKLVGTFDHSTVRSKVGFGDLLQGEVGKSHESGTLLLARKIWPRPLIRRLNVLGLMLLIEATK